MAPLSNHVTLSVTRDSVGITRAGFGTMLMLSPNATFAERVRSYASFAEFIVDFAVTTSPEYLAASAYFAQNPKPNLLKVGRQALKATQVVTIVPTVRNSYIYNITVKGKGFTGGTATFTSDSSATAAEVLTGITNALNGITGNNYTAANDGATTITVTGDAAGDWFSLEVEVYTGDYALTQTHVDPGVATDLAAIVAEDNDWYALYTFQNSNAIALAVASWAETNEKFYIMDACDTNCDRCPWWQ
jgi:hypothetical protein